MFSKSCKYGLRAVIFIAQSSTQNKKMSMLSIAEEIDSPQAFTSKILQKLRHENIINSIKGPYGGFFIENEKMSEIKLSDIVKVLDGDAIYKNCALGLKACSNKFPCPMHYQFTEIREKLRNTLENTSLDDLTKEMKTSETWLKI